MNKFKYNTYVYYPMATRPNLNGGTYLTNSNPQPETTKLMT